MSNVVPPSLATVLRSALIQGRKLDQSNPNPGNLGADFGRLGMQFWVEVNGLAKRNPKRQKALETLNTWRNAIAHQDWQKVGPNLHLGEVKRWRSALQSLAISFDAAVCKHLAALVCKRPW